MAISSDAPQVVVLKGGVSVLLPAIQLALELEDRGLRFEALSDDVLEVRPARLLTDADRVRIREWKWELLRIARYQAPEVA